MQSFSFKIWMRRFFWLTRKKKIYAACFQLRIMAWRYIFTHACPRRKGKKLRDARAVRSHFSIYSFLSFFFLHFFCSAQLGGIPPPFHFHHRFHFFLKTFSRFCRVFSSSLHGSRILLLLTVDSRFHRELL